MLCQSCGHDNPEKNRYCGMCGVRLQATAEPAREPAAPKPVARPAAAASGSSSSILGLDREAAPPPDRPRPVVTGPSFLGLNSEPDPSSYLLDEDEEEGGHRGLWMMLGLVVVLVAAGFYFRAELSARAAPLYAAVLGRVNPQPPAPVAAPATPAATDSATATASTPPPATSDTPPAAAASPAATPEDKPAPATDTKADAKPAEPAKPASDVAEDTAPKKQTAEPAKLARASRPKPRVAEAVAPKDDPLLKLAQKYIHGQGVRADCATGMAYLREAMKRPSYAAASQMGALYATGTCVPLDRVAAYRWFTSAMQMAPKDPWLGQERDKLYGQMSSAERRQADQLSLR